MKNKIQEQERIKTESTVNNLDIIITILETQISFNIIFIQELSWFSIRSIPSSTSCESIKLVEVLNHPN